MPKKKNKRKIYRSAVDGEFISKAEADANPEKTVSQMVDIGTRSTTDQDDAEGSPQTPESPAETENAGEPTFGGFAGAQIADLAKPGDCETELLEIGHQEAITRGIE